MADVVNRTTKEYRQSVNTPEFPTATWIHNPDLSAVTGFASKYWIITGDAITLMDVAARAVVDAVELEAARDATSNELDALESSFRALALVTLAESNKHANKINAILDAIDGAASLADVKTAIAAIADIPTRTTADVKTALRATLGNSV